MFTFSKNIEEIRVAARVCYEHGLHDACTALEEDLEKDKFIEILKGVPWAGECLAEIVEEGWISKNDMPIQVQLHEKEVELYFDKVDVRISLVEDDWKVILPDDDGEWDDYFLERGLDEE